MQKNTILRLISLFIFIQTSTLLAKNTSEEILKKAQLELPQQCIFYFKMYLNAEAPKAFAYAVDSKDKVTCRFSTSSISQKRANEVALFSCQKSSLEKNIISDCKIYKTINNTKSKKKLSFQEKYLLNLNAIKKDIAKKLEHTKKQKIHKAKKHITKALKKKEKTSLKKHPKIKKTTTIAKTALKTKKASIHTLPKPCHLFYALYQKAPAPKAFAIAIDDHDKKYVCKFSAKSDSPKKAREVALASCEKARLTRGVKQACHLFTHKEDKQVKTKSKSQKTDKNKKTLFKKPAKKVIPSDPTLEKAILEANLGKIKKLITKGANVNSIAKDKARALFVAVAQGDVDFTKELFEKGAFPFFRNQDGNNLLVAAIMSGKNSMLKLVLEHGLDPNIRCEEGNTPLHFALMMFDDQMMKTLYKFNARDDIDNKKGQSVQDLAKEYHVDLKRIKR